MGRPIQEEAGTEPEPPEPNRTEPNRAEPYGWLNRKESEPPRTGTVSNRNCLEPRTYRNRHEPEPLRTGTVPNRFWAEPVSPEPNRPHPDKLEIRTGKVDTGPDRFFGPDQLGDWIGFLVGTGLDGTRSQSL